MKFFAVLFLAVAIAGCGNKPSSPVPLAQPLTITAPDELPEATMGRPYTFTLTAAGGVPPYSWNLVASSIPKTDLTTGGVLTLTPQQSYPMVSPAQIVVTVTDSASTQSILKLN